MTKSHAALARSEQAADPFPRWHERRAQLYDQERLDFEEVYLHELATAPSRLRGRTSAAPTSAAVPTSEQAAALALQAVPAPEARSAISGRRTVRIQGRPGAARLVEVRRRRPRRPTRERFASRPDKAALWTVGLAVALVLIAAASSHAAPPVAPGGSHGAPAHVLTLP